MKKIYIVAVAIIVLVVAAGVFFTQRNMGTSIVSNDTWCNELPKAAKEFNSDDTESERHLQIINGMIAEQLEQPKFEKYNITRNELCAHELAFMEVSKRPPVSTNGGNSYSFSKVQVSDLAKYIGEERAVKVLEAKTP